MRVLITGAAGYIGSHTLLRVLGDDHEVCVIDVSTVIPMRWRVLAGCQTAVLKYMKPICEMPMRCMTA